MLQEVGSKKEILELSCTEFALSLDAGECVVGQFTIHADTYVYGDIYSSDTRVRNVQKHFESNSTIEVEINGTNLVEGNELLGKFTIISNVGEYVLPFHITVSIPQLNSTQGEIKNLFHFANLAQLSWKEAVDVFYDPNFSNIFSKKEQQFFTIYRGLSKQPGNESNVEEFLVSISKKLPIDYQLDTDGVILENIFSSIHEYIHVKKSGWGYTNLKIEKTGDFFTLSHEVISNEDFDNNIATIDLFLDAAKLKPGANLGTIRVYNTQIHLCIPVRIMMDSVDKNKRQEKEIPYEYQLAILNTYIGSKITKASSKTQLTQAKRIVEQWLEEDDEAILPSLYKVQILLIEERLNEAEWYLDEIGNRLRKEEVDIVIKAYYYYLTTLYNRDEAYLDSVIHFMENALDKNKKQWRIALLLLYVNDDISKSDEKKWQFLRNQYDNGCISPILYGEALEILENNPSMLLRLEAFEQHVLWYGAKNHYISVRLQEHIEYAATKETNFSLILHSLLSTLYERRPSDELLTSICRLLISGCKNKTEYFRWYKLAVDKGIRLTGLYEYYMYSMDKNKKIEIPRMLLLYFNYQSQLVPNESALLYRYVLEKAEKEPEIANNYEAIIERFVIDQIKARRINKNLAYLYENMIVPQMLRDDAAYSFTPLLFMHEITVDNPAITSVVLVQERIKGESTYPLENGKCQLPIYAEDFRLFLQDDNGNRFVKSIAYTDEQMMDYEVLLPEIHECLEGRPSFDFFECEREHAAITLNKKNAERYKRLADSPLTEDSLKAELRTKLLHFYYDEDRIGELDAFLEDISDDELENNERSEFMRFLITRGKFDKAYIWLKKYGASGVNQKNIARLVSKRIQSSEYMEDDFLKNVAFYVFRNAKYDEPTLIYLIKYYNGKIRDLRDIWKAATDLELDCGVLEERILDQMLVTSEMVAEKNDILISYEQREEHNAMLVEKYYEDISRGFFVNEELVENTIFVSMYERLKNNKCTQLQKLALLKFWSQSEKNIENIPEELIEELMVELYNNKLYFAFFKELAKHASKLHFMEDRFYIEYHSHNNNKVKLHYIYAEAPSLSEEDDENYRVEEMTEMLEGIYVKEFTLFSGEILQYYISEESKDIEKITYSNSIECETDKVREQGGRFTKLNDVIVSLELAEEISAKELLKDYLYSDYCAREFFRTI